MRIACQKVCQTCRQRKLGCDGKLPGCTQCHLSYQSCPGYPQVLKIVQHAPHVKGVATKFAKGASCDAKTSVLRYQGTDEHQRTAPNIGRNRSFSCRLSHEQTICIITEHYMPEKNVSLRCLGPNTSHARICGSWVEVLPSFGDQHQNYRILSAALETLAFSLLRRNLTRDAAYLRISCSVLRSLRKALKTNSDTFDADLAAASMCLTLAEVMQPSTLNGWAFHIKGAGELIRRSSPLLHSSGVPHNLFVGFRPLILIQALHDRQATFLALEEWQSIPFSVHPPSYMQTLLSHAALMPSILQKIDSLGTSTSEDIESAVRDICDSLLRVQNLFKEWESSLLLEYGGVAFWPAQNNNDHKCESQSKQERRSVVDSSLIFPDLSTANSLTHLWAFQIILFTELEYLAKRIPESRRAMQVFGDFHMDTRVLAVKICQSASFLLSNDMRLYGPASTLFTLRTACQVFQLNAAEASEQVQWCRMLVDQLVSKGIVLAASFIGGDTGQ